MESGSLTVRVIASSDLTKACVSTAEMLAYVIGLSIFGLTIGIFGHNLLVKLVG